MPAPPVDAGGLRARAADIGLRFGDLDSLQISLRLLLLDYADPGQRSATPLPGESAATTYGVPLPVLRAVVNALRRRSLAAPLAALVLIDRLWRAGSQEERRIACELLAVVEPRAPADGLRLVESWLAGLADSAGAEMLASVGCAPLMRANPGARLDDVRRWLASENEWVRRFAALAVVALARDKGYHDPQALLEALRDAMVDPSTEVRRGVVTALWEIGAKSPAELGRFLRPYAGEDSAAVRWILRQTMNGLPARSQREIGNLNREA